MCRSISVSAYFSRSVSHFLSRSPTSPVAVCGTLENISSSISANYSLYFNYKLITLNVPYCGKYLPAMCGNVMFSLLLFDN